MACLFIQVLSYGRAALLLLQQLLLCVPRRHSGWEPWRVNSHRRSADRLKSGDTCVFSSTFFPFIFTRGDRRSCSHNVSMIIIIFQSAHMKQTETSLHSLRFACCYLLDRETGESTSCVSEKFLSLLLLFYNNMMVFWLTFNHCFCPNAAAFCSLWSYFSKHVSLFWLTVQPAAFITQTQRESDAFKETRKSDISLLKSATLFFK